MNPVEEFPHDDMLVRENGVENSSFLPAGS
jgi:hypothetical protein